jgi:hypothetical protein
VRSLARHWAGTGSLFEWLAPSDWDITRRWSVDIMRARAAYVILLQVEASILPRLPRHAGEWMDVLEQEIHRSTEFADVPSAHTDWAATLSTFGRYPSPLYVERLPRGTFDTPLTRTLKWVCSAVMRAEKLVDVALRHRPLLHPERRRLFSALDLPEVQGAADVMIVDEADLAACSASGPVGVLVARCARQLAILWRGSIQAQLELLSQLPILPEEVKGALFELGTLGSAAMAAREVLTQAVWITKTPLAAAESGVPCLTAEFEEGEINCYYQTVPQVYRRAVGPYRTLSRELGGGTLRPDMWLLLDMPAGPIELVLECKYSLDNSYISTGVIEVLAYSREYPAKPEVQRIHMVVCPEAVIVKPQSWGKNWPSARRVTCAKWSSTRCRARRQGCWPSGRDRILSHSRVRPFPTVTLITVARVSGGLLGPPIATPSPKCEHRCAQAEAAAGVRYIRIERGGSCL